MVTETSAQPCDTPAVSQGAIRVEDVGKIFHDNAGQDLVALGAVTLTVLPG